MFRSISQNDYASFAAVALSPQPFQPPARTLHASLRGGLQRDEHSDVVNHPGQERFVADRELVLLGQIAAVTATATQCVHKSLAL